MDRPYRSNRGTVTCIAALLMVLACSAAEGQSAAIRGRVVDRDGRPLGDVPISAGAGAMGNEFWFANAVIPPTRSDAQGVFELAVPFPGVLYSVLAEMSGYSTGWQSVIAGEGQEVLMHLQRGPHEGRVRGRIIDDEEHGVGEVEVRLVGESGFAVTARTDRSGTFDFRDLPSYFGQGVLVAGSGGRTVPLMIVRANDKGPMEVPLVDSARIAGRVIDRQSGEAIAGATVRLRPTFGSGFRLDAISDAQGKWQIEDIPPGSYLVEPDAPGHFDKPPRGYSFEREPVRLVGLQSLEHDIALDRMATIAGTVVGADGAPVAGALVGIRAGWDDGAQKQLRCVRSGADGRFRISTGHLDEALMLSVFHGEAGLGSAKVEPLKEGEGREGARVVLNGAVKVRGLVSDEASRPIEHVTCAIGWMSQAQGQTDARGRFDLGLIPLPGPPRKQCVLQLQPPRPARGIWRRDGGWPLPAVQGDLAGKTFYESSQSPINAEPGATAELKATLKAAELLTIRGRVVDRDGKPLADASVHAFAGNAPESWKAFVSPFRSRGNFAIMGPAPLGGSACDADGRFVIFVIRSEGEAAAEGTRYSVGIVVRDEPRRVMTDVIVAKSRDSIDLGDVRAEPDPEPTTRPGR